MVGLGRFELPTNGLGNRCSIHLSYSPGLLIVIRGQCNTLPLGASRVVAVAEPVLQLPVVLSSL
jgi:hypothetical protein